MTTPKQRNERLSRVCRVLRELPKGKRSNLAVWHVCSMVACPCGWAAVDRWFTRRGFRLKQDDLGFYVPAFGNYTSWRAVREFFGLGFDASERLFTGAFYKRGHRRDVIRRIEKFVRDNPA